MARSPAPVTPSENLGNKPARHPGRVPDCGNRLSRVMLFLKSRCFAGDADVPVEVCRTRLSRERSERVGGCRLSLEPVISIIGDGRCFPSRWRTAS